MDNDFFSRKTVPSSENRKEYLLYVKINCDQEYRKKKKILRYYTEKRVRLKISVGYNYMYKWNPLPKIEN